MEGFVKLIADDTGIGAQVSLSHFSELDKVLLLRAFAEALNMDDAHLVAGAKLVPVIRALMKDTETVENNVEAEDDE